MNEAMLSAIVELAARCAECPRPPSVEEATAYANKIADTRGLARVHRQELRHIASDLANPMKQATSSLIEWCIEQECSFPEEAVVEEAGKVATYYELNDWERRGLVRAARSFAVTAKRLGTWHNWLDTSIIRNSFLLEAATFAVP